MLINCIYTHILLYSKKRVILFFRSLDRLDMTLHKELLSMKDENRSQRLLEEKLRKLQRKVSNEIIFIPNQSAT